MRGHQLCRSMEDRLSRGRNGRCKDPENMLSRFQAQGKLVWLGQGK